MTKKVYPPRLKAGLRKYRCVKRNCRVELVLIDGKEVKILQSHNHPSNPKQILKLKVENKIKTRTFNPRVFY